MHKGLRLQLTAQASKHGSQDDQVKFSNNNNNNNNLYLSVKAKIAVTEPLNGDTISEIYIYINTNIKVH